MLSSRTLLSLTFVYYISSVSATTLSSSCIQAYIDAALALHNSLRANCSAPALTIDSALNTYAQNWADNLTNSNTFVHSSGSYGENLASNSYSNAQTVTDTMCATLGRSQTQMWYDEISSYSYSSPGFSSATGHFTQVVWVSTTKVGFGFQSIDNQRFVGVGSYDPPGNYVNQFSTNVLTCSTSATTTTSTTTSSSATVTTTTSVTTSAMANTTKSNSFTNSAVSLKTEASNWLTAFSFTIMALCLRFYH